MQEMEVFILYGIQEENNECERLGMAASVTFCISRGEYGYFGALLVVGEFYYLKFKIDSSHP